MFTLAHLSDPHLAPLPRPAFHQLFSKRALGYANWSRRRLHYRREVLYALMEDLLSQTPDHIAVTGDLVNIALPEEFRAARHWLESVGDPSDITVIPGNHDAYVPFLHNPWLQHWLPYMTANAGGKAYDVDDGQPFPFIRRFGDIALVGLSSARATMPAMASGRLGRRQMLQAAELLKKLGREGLCRVVLIHHPPLPGMTPWQRALHDARAFQSVLNECGAELVLHGHNHKVMMRRMVGKAGPVPIVGAPSASFLSSDPLHSASFNLLTIVREASEWRISMRSRSFAPEGEVVETREELLP